MVTLTHEDVREKFPKFKDHVRVSRRFLVCGKDSGKPPVLLLHELPGLSAQTLDYASCLAQGSESPNCLLSQGRNSPPAYTHVNGGFTVYVPLLFGDLYQRNMPRVFSPLLLTGNGRPARISLGAR